jgi:hypothetical protein
MTFKRNEEGEVEGRRDRIVFIDVYMRKRIVIKYYYPFELEGIEKLARKVQ